MRHRELGSLVRRALNRHVPMATGIIPARKAAMPVICRGRPPFHRSRFAPANDNGPAILVPDHDRPFFLALSLVCASVLILAAYAIFDGLRDVVAIVGR